MTDETNPKEFHCPRCGKLQFKEICVSCGFNSDPANNRDHIIARLLPWNRAVRAELARQALELRAHSFADCSDETIGVKLRSAHIAVLSDYERLGQHPLRLPGEDA